MCITYIILEHKVIYSSSQVFFIFFYFEESVLEKIVMFITQIF